MLIKSPNLSIYSTNNKKAEDLSSASKFYTLILVYLSLSSYYPYFTTDKLALIPALEFISHALAYASLRRFFAPLNINSTHSFVFLADCAVIFFIF